MRDLSECDYRLPLPSHLYTCLHERSGTLVGPYVKCLTLSPVNKFSLTFPHTYNSKTVGN